MFNVKSTCVVGVTREARESVGNVSSDGYLHCKGGCGSMFRKIEPLKRHEEVCTYVASLKASSPATPTSNASSGGLKLTPVSKLVVPSSKSSKKRVTHLKPKAETEIKQEPQ